MIKQGRKRVPRKWYQERVETQALRLMMLILDEMDPTRFSLEEIQEEFNTRKEGKKYRSEYGDYGHPGPVNRFGLSHLKILIRFGLIRRLRCAGRVYEVIPEAAHLFQLGVQLVEAERGYVRHFIPQDGVLVENDELN